MAKIIKAICTTASADDKMGRVRLKSDGVWNQDTELVQSLNGCTLSKGDVVFVSVEDGYYNPLILGKADRNEIVLNLLVERINSLEDKLNEAVNKQNEVIMKLAASASAAGFVWSGAATFAAVQPLQTIPTKTQLRDIQDNYK
jgi:hypothetical protein